MNFSKGVVGLITASCVLTFTQVGASANPFNSILNTINGVNRTVNSLDNTINGTNHTINSLSETLGINSGDVSLDNAESTEQVQRIYEVWHRDLTPTEQETVAWLVMEHARNQAVTFDTISVSDWFMQKPIEEQSKVASTFFKLQSLIDATAQDRNQFLGFAFCVNAGTDSCSM